MKFRRSDPGPSLSVKLYSLEYKEAKTYLTAALFIAGNILLPQLCHLVHFWGHTRLPIYFFALIGACKYGWRVGERYLCRR